MTSGSSDQHEGGCASRPDPWLAAFLAGDEYHRVVAQHQVTWEECPDPKCQDTFDRLWPGRRGPPMTPHIGS